MGPKWFKLSKDPEKAWCNFVQCKFCVNINRLNLRLAIKTAGYNFFKSP